MSNVMKDLSGLTINYLTVHEFHKNKGWRCTCTACGTEVFKVNGDFTRNQAVSCGCIRRTHHLSNSLSWSSWKSMRDRCLNPKCEQYKWYGARGISIDPKWLKFKGFYEDMGDRPEGTTLDRKDFNGNYTKENCRWATVDQQNNNTRYNVFVTYRGETLSLTHMAKKYGKNRDLVLNRYRIGGWSIEDAIEKPVNKLKGRKVFLTHNGETLSAKEWSEKTGIPTATIRLRALIGWPIKDVLEIPVSRNNKKHYK